MASEIEVFLNEVSLEDHYFSGTDFEQSVKELTSQIREVFDVFGFPFAIRRSSFLESFRLRCGQVFSRRLNTEVNKEIRELFRSLVYDKANAVFWESEQQHDHASEYIFRQKNVCGTSLAELAERSLNSEYFGVLVSFKPSWFDDVEWFWVVKNGKESKVRNYVGKQRLYFLVASTLGIVDERYDHSSSRPPLDRETVLRDQGRFEETNLLNQGRRIYRELTSRRFLCVDQLHHGTAAHLEVWDKRGRHLGEASIEGILDSSKQDPSKNMNF